METPGESKEFTKQAQHGVKGEAFFESLISNYAIPHHVTGLKDIGIDFFCEWVHDQKPSGVLFAVQVKTAIERRVTVTSDGRSDCNRLDEHTLSGSCAKDLMTKEATRNYWSGLGIPVYLFVVVLGEDGSPGRCYYKRYTPWLTEWKAMQDGDFFSGFYRANDGNRFLAFSDPDVGTGGFARDLFIDYTRCQYSSGLLNPRKLGLKEFPEDVVFPEFAEPYRKSIEDAFKRAGLLLHLLRCGEQPQPGRVRLDVKQSEDDPSRYDLDISCT